MKRILVVLSSLLTPMWAAAEAPPVGLLADQAQLGSAITAGEVTIFPLIVKGVPKDMTAYATLDEALDSKHLVIKETDTSGTVSALHVSNTGDKPIFAMAGEVVLGGKQDRIVGKNVIIEKGAKEQKIAVFCVEHGRWNHKTARFSSAKTMAHLKLRQQAYKGSQSRVWKEVAETNARRKTSNATDTYQNAIKRSASSKEVAQLVKALRAGTRGVDNMAGVVIAYAGKPQAVDWFGNPKLYRRLEGKLLTSYVTQALDSRDGKKYAPPPKSKAGDWIKQVSRAKRRATGKTKSGQFYQFDNVDIDGTLATDKDGNAIHEGYIAK